MKWSTSGVHGSRCGRKLVFWLRRDPQRLYGDLVEQVDPHHLRRGFRDTHHWIRQPMPIDDVALYETIDYPSSPPPPAEDLERKVAFESIRAHLFSGPRQPVSIDRFVVSERVGQGGMGVVYSAFDPQLERKVAIKVVRDLGSSPEEIGRARRCLEREARAAAGLAHPNVVTVYDSGLFGSDFYLAMEFVEGRTLRHWLKPERSWVDIVAMFTGAGLGLQAAHAAGLAHCDFKPANVLIGGDGRPRVTDFGLVRWLESRSEPSMEQWPSQTTADASTVQSTIAGTARYMAPEQRRGLPIGPRSDQFSFCVGLYEALFDKPPFDRDEHTGFESPGDLGRAHVGTAVPRAVVRALLVGLAITPERRHPSMQSLVDRLNRALAARRRRKWWALGGVLAASTGLVGYALAEEPLDPCEGAAEAIEEVWSDEAQEDVQRRMRSHGAGEAGALRVSHLIDGYAGQWASMRVASCEATHHRGEQSTGLFELRTACLDRRRHTLENLVDRLRGGDERLLDQAISLAEGMTPVRECEAEVVRVSTITNVAASHNDLSRSPETDASSRAAYELLDRGRLMFAEGDFDGSLTAFRDVESKAHEAGLRQLEAIAIRLRVGQQMLMGSFESVPDELRPAVALAVEAGDYGSAALCVALIVQARRRGSPDGANPQLLLTIGRAWASKSVQPALYLAEIDIEEASSVEAQGHGQDALKILEGSVERLQAGGFSDHSMTFRVQMLRAQMLIDVGTPDAAAGVLNEVLNRQRELLGPNHIMVADGKVTLGGAKRMQGDLEAAKANYVEARRIYIYRLGPNSSRTAIVMGELAGVYEGLGDLGAARGALDQSIATHKALGGPDNPSLAIPLNDLAELEHETGSFEEGLEHAQAAVKIASAAFGPQHPYTAVFKGTMGKLQLTLGDAAGAVATLSDAHATLTAPEQTSPDWRGEVAFLLARAVMQLDSGRRSEADALSRGAISDYAQAQGDGSQQALAEITTWRREQDFADGTPSQ